ncbi:MAG: hypothetical protein M1393_01875 [Candidatus Thermoplasmatota archaeon]|nr:hypothetical protein [Candidatus Thermoplasmatota archaeon]
MQLILYAIPTAILVATLVISRFVRGGFREYINDLEQKVGELEGVLNLTFMKELLDFFVSSKASKAAERVVSTAESDPEKVHGVVTDAARSSGQEIESLYDSMKRALQPSVDLERVKFVSGLINQLIMLYGISIAAVEYLLITLTFVPSYAGISRTLDGVFFGVTVIFGIFVIVIVFDLSRYSGRINGAIRKLTGESATA